MNTFLAARITFYPARHNGETLASAALERVTGGKLNQEQQHSSSSQPHELAIGFQSSQHKQLKLILFLSILVIICRIVADIASQSSLLGLDQITLAILLPAFLYWLRQHGITFNRQTSTYSLWWRILCFSHQKSYSRSQFCRLVLQHKPNLLARSGAQFNQSFSLKMTDGAKSIAITETYKLAECLATANAISEYFDIAVDDQVSEWAKDVGYEDDNRSRWQWFIGGRD